MALSAMATAIKELYGMAENINEWLDRHIEDMKASDNPTISRSGRVLDMAKLGFGLGYITPVIIISAGQLLLGNTLNAVMTVATAATLSNPVAMTCAAIGAIYYGWSALTELERQDIIGKLSKGLEIGIELIKSIIRFVISTIKEFTDNKYFIDLKEYIGKAANNFGRTLSDVTRTLKDKAFDYGGRIKQTTIDVIDTTIRVANETSETIATTVVKATDGIQQATDKITGKQPGQGTPPPRKDQ